MGKNGGPRPGAGRKPKVQEIKIIEQMDAIAVPEKIWGALLRKCEEGDTQALKLWLAYRLGLPKQQIDITSNGERVAPPIHWISKGIDIQDAQIVSDEPPALHHPGLDYPDSDYPDSDYPDSDYPDSQ